MLVFPEESVAIVADLMGLDPERLKWGLKNKKIKTMREVIDKPLNAEQAKDQTDAFAKHAYATLFDWTVQQLNANMISETFKSFIGVLDIFGFEVFEVCLATATAAIATIAITIIMMSVIVVLKQVISLIYQ